MTKKNFLCLMLLLALSNQGIAQSKFDKYKSSTNHQSATNKTVEIPANPELGDRPQEKNSESVKDFLTKQNNAPQSDKQAKINPNVENMPDIDPDNNMPKNADNIEALGEESDNQDIFGRGTGINSVKNVVKDKKYVNLNPETAFGPEVVESFDFPDISLSDLTKHMQKLTGINLILDKELKGRISIMAPTAITVGDAWQAYLTALNLNDYTLVKHGAFYKIVNARDIRYTSTKIYTGNFAPNTENYVMKIIPLKNISSAEVTRSFRPFQSRYGRIIDIPQTNTVIIQDTGTNINRLGSLIKFIDVPGHEESLQIIPVKNTSAQEIAKLLDEILKSKTTQKTGMSPGGTKNLNMRIIAEPRTNSIIAMANEDGAKELRALIAKLDVKLISSGSGLIHVYYLNYGNAEVLAKTLSELVSSSKSNQNKFTSASSRGGEVSTLFSAEVKITADVANNALVVTASPTDYLTVKNVIKKLDIPRDQVYLEGLILETQVDRASSFGISVVGAYGTGMTQRAGFTGGSSDLVNLISQNITSLSGLFIGGGLGKKITQTAADGSTVQINSVNGLISAIASDTNSNVLATPQLLALDNVDAVFEVGETVPISEQTNAANGATSTSIKQQKVSLVLKFTPQINKASRTVNLKIDQKIEDFSNRALPEGMQNGVGTTLRSAVTTVTVRDRDTIAMGGLMRDKELTTEAKVPLLGDIPIIGWLFKHTSKSISKVNLLFFLTPKILASYEKTVAKNVKDVINRRSIHMKDYAGEDDSFGPTLKGLYEKAEKQDQGPLFDKTDDINNDETIKYNNDDEEVLPKTEEELVSKNINTDPALSETLDTPDYKAIVEDIEKSKAAPITQ